MSETSLKYGLEASLGDQPEYRKLLRLLAEESKEHSPPMFIQITDAEYAYNHLIELEYNSPTFGQTYRRSKVSELLEILKRKGFIDILPVDDRHSLTLEESEALQKPVYGGFLGDSRPDRILVLKVHQRGRG